MPDTIDSQSVEAQINYLAPGSFVNRRFVAPAQEVNTGEYLPYPVVIRDARPHQEDFTLDSHGFTLLAHRSAVRDFMDKEEGSYRHSGGVQPPAGEAHVDTSPDRADRMAHAIYKQHFPDAPPFTRYLYTSFWRTFSPPPQDCPLALCDGTSVGDDEGTPNTMYVVDKIPDREEMLRPMADEDKVIAAAVFRHNPAHQWWYFSDMTRDEALLFKFHDSRRVKPWRVPHTAFYSNRLDAHPRESIEFRSIAYFS